MEKLCSSHLRHFSGLAGPHPRAGPIRLVAAPTLLAMSNEPATLRAADAAEGSEIRLTLTPQIASNAEVVVLLTVTMVTTHAREPRPL